MIAVSPSHESEQHVVYIGRSKGLSRRLKQFYDNQHGDKAPPRGGQDILKLDGKRTVHWASAADYGKT